MPCGPFDRARAMRIGIDLGGTKTEIVALDGRGHEIHRKRVDTPAASYDAVVATLAGLVCEAEAALGQRGTVGVGLSNVDELYEMVPPQLANYVFGGEAETPVVRSQHGDSSGVRGAAWLWD